MGSVVEAGIFIGADGGVELAAGVAPPKAVEAGLIEEDRAGGAGEIVGEVVLGANRVIIRVALNAEARGVPVEQKHQVRGAITDGAVGVDEFAVGVAKEGAEVREAVFEKEENVAAAEEGLEVAVDVSWKKGRELREQTGLAAGPFQEGAWLAPSALKLSRGGGGR